VRVVVDTNVWVSGLIRPDGVPGAVLEAARIGLIEPIASWALADELVDVLRRPSIRRYGVTEGDIEELLTVIGPLLPDVDVTVEVRDPVDASVVAAAVAALADAIVTGDRDILDDDRLRAWLADRSIEVLAPAELLEGLRR
jgi:hypothetical protein